MLELLNYSIGGTLLLLLFGVVLWLAPFILLSCSISRLKTDNIEYTIIRETDTYYLINGGIRVYKKCFDTERGYFICDYGVYLPRYNINDDIVALVYMKGGKA